MYIERRRLKRWQQEAEHWRQVAEVQRARPVRRSVRGTADSLDTIFAPPRKRRAS